MYVLLNIVSLFTHQGNSLNNIVRVTTVEDVRAEFERRGLSISEWARQHGVSAQLTYQILAGRKIGLRGQSHTISVLLGLKTGVTGTAGDLTFVRQADQPSPKQEEQEDRHAQPA